MTKTLLLAFVAASSAACLLFLERDPAPSPAARRADGHEPLVAFTSAHSHPLGLAGEPQEEFLHVSLRAAEVPGVERLPVNLALVIDRSGSMASEDKLRHAQSAAEQLVGRLRPEDRLALVSYDDRVVVEVPSAPLTDPGSFCAAIRALAPGRNTDLCSGMLAGHAEVRAHFDEERLNAVVLLSDGLANSGVSDAREIAERARRCHGEGVRITTMGMGLEYDEDLLTGIALGAGGNYYYVDRPESVGELLDAELEELGRVVARDVEVRIELGEGVEMRELFGHAWRMEGRSVVVPLRDLCSGQKRKLVLRLGVEGTPGAERPLARASLRYVGAETRARYREDGALLAVRFCDDALAVERARDRSVLIQAEIVQDAAALDAAMRLQKKGDFQAAQELLAARYLTSKTLNDTEYDDAEVERILRRMKQVMIDLERTRADPSARRDLQLATQLQALGYGGN